MEKQGKVTESGVLHFERFFKSSIEKVWTYLTDSEKRGKWLATGEMELFVGGKVTLHFRHRDLSPLPGRAPEMFASMEEGHSFTGKVLACEPPRLLTFTWQGDSEVTFELTEQNDGVLLSLTHRKLADTKNTRINVLTGWHTHLEILEANLDGQVPQNFWVLFVRFQKDYEQAIA